MNKYQQINLPEILTAQACFLPMLTFEIPVLAEFGIMSFSNDLKLL